MNLPRTVTDRDFVQRRTRLALAGLVLVMLFAMSVKQRLQAAVVAGDIAIIGYNASTTDEFRIVFLGSGTAGDVVSFTDDGWQSSGSFRTGEGIATYTVQAGGISAGTTVNWQNGATLPAGWTSGSGGSANNPTNFAFNASGDSLIAYTGTLASPTVVYGIQQGTTWNANATSAATSAEPVAANGGPLETRVTTNAFGGVNGYYSGAMTAGTKTLLQAAIANATNWTTSGSVISNTNFASSFTLGAEADIFWDANATTAGTGGAGIWDATTNNLFKSAAADSSISYFRWVNSSTGNDHTAVFGGTAGGVTASGLTFDVSGYTLSNNTVTLGGSTPTVTVTNSSDTATISSALGGSAGLAKSGAGVLVLSGTNTYTGTTTVSAGVLQVGISGAGDTGAGAMNVTGGTLAGTGTVRASSVTFSNGTKLAAGDVTGLGVTGIGTLTFTPVTTGTYDIGAGAEVALDLTAGGTSDKLVFNGGAGSTLTLNGRVKIGAAVLTPTAPEVFNLLDWGALVTPTFAAHFSTNLLRDGSADNGSDFDLPDISGSGFGWDVSSFIIDGSIAIMAVPEPGRAGLLMLGLLVLVRYRKRYNSTSPCH